ncbi:MAG: TonB-dependent receptor [Pseudomonadota bacterium]
MKKFELLAATALAMTVAMPAAAQTGTTSDQVNTTDQNAVEQSNTAPASTDDYTSANEVVVTATRRSDTVQNVPVAITAVSAELLDNAGVTDIRGLEQLAPSLQTTTGQSTATGSSLSVRGIGTAGDNPGFEPAVGVFIDGVFRSRAGVALSELPELERVEILRGPQGTLFGRNTSAGALSVYTARPQFKFAGYVEGSYGNYDAYSIKGGVTGPATESLALRLDGGYRQRDGYIKDANSDRRINNLDRYFVRAQALYDSTDVTFRLIADYSKTDEQCCGAVSAVRGPLAAVVQGVAASRGRVGLYTGAPSDRIQAISPERNYGERVRDFGVSGELNANLGDNLKLTSITAYRDWRALRDQDIDFSGIDRAYRDDYKSTLRDITQELRLQGSAFDDRLDFLFGGFYLNENLKLRDTVRFGTDANLYVDTIFASSGGQFFGSRGATVPQFGALLLGAPLAALPAALQPLATLFRAQAGVAPIAGVPIIPGLAAVALAPIAGNSPGQGNNNDDFRVKTNAFALFTHNIVKITDQLSLTLGARYNREEKDLDASINNNTGGCAFFFSTAPATVAYRNALRLALGANFNNFFLLSCNPAVNTEFNGVYDDEKKENALTGTVKLAYKFSPRILGYASYDRGYKSGGYNLDQASFDTAFLGGNGAQASDLEFGREKVNAYEIGLKTSFSRAFTFNIAGFYQEIKGLQSLIFSGNNFVVQNIPDATSKGVELEAVIQPVRELVFRMGYTYNDAVLDKSNNFTGTPLAGREGTQFGNVPKNVVTLTGTWTPALTDRLDALLHVDMRYNSDVSLDASQVIRNDGYALVSGRVGIQTDDKKISVEAFVDNIFKKYYNITGFAVPEQTGNFAVYPSPPRFYGVRARFGF